MILDDAQPLPAVFMDSTRPEGVPQVAFFGSDMLNINEMCKEVNEFLYSWHKEGDIISDIKYTVSDNCYSVMVIYYVKEEEKGNKE